MASPSIERLIQVTRNQGQPIQQFISGATWVDQVAVSTSAATYDIPEGAAFLRITPTSGAGATYGSFVEVAVTPAAGKTDGSGSFPIPAAGLCVVAPPGVTTISIISASNGYVTIEVWN